MKTPTPEQLRLAANIIEQNLKWQVRLKGGRIWHNPDGTMPMLEYFDQWEIRIKPEPKLVPLGPEDVPPGTVLRGCSEINEPGWCAITSCSFTGIRIWRQSEPNYQDEVTWKALMDSKSEIMRPGEDWNPCSKVAP